MLVALRSSVRAPERPEGRCASRLLAVFILGGLLLAGCVCPEKADMAALSATWQVVGPEYRAYVEADPQLDEGRKANRRDAVALLDRVVAGYQKRGK